VENNLPDPAAPPRVLRLLQRFPPTGQEKTWHPNGADERSLLLWRYFQDHPLEPLALRCANGLAHVLRQVAIVIHADELIVGEVGVENVALTRAQELAQADAFWQGRNAAFVRSFSWHAAEQRAGSNGLSWKWTSRDGHAIPAFDLILSAGLEGLRLRARQASRRAGRNRAAQSRRVFWEALVVSLQALSEYIQRYAALARRKAQAEPSPVRRAELREIAASCAWLADNPPRTFAEALQLVWFAHLGIKMDDGGVGHSFGRFDQYLYPFYRADRAAGRLAEARALELLACFWVKLNRECDDIAHLSLGGQTPDGQDAANELTTMCLQVERWISRKQPNLSIRVHSRTSEHTWEEIARTIRCGAGHPAVFNDDVIIPGLLAYGLPLAEVRAYAQVGCVETCLPGLSAPWTDCYLNLAKCLELALHNGRDGLSGALLGPQTGDSLQFAAFEDLLSAYELQVEHALQQMLSAKDEYDARLAAHAPEPLNSAFIRDCLERGCDAAGGGARYLLTGVYGVGLGTAVDSLAAVRALVYESGMASMPELLDALRENFSGREPLRLVCRNRLPKYGNDDDRADDVAVRIIESFGRQVKAYSDQAWDESAKRDPAALRRAYHYAMFGSVLSHTSMGALTAASADGRLAGQTLSDGGSPVQGCSRRGATAALKSLAKADYSLAPGGAAMNLRLSPEHYEGQAGIELLADLLKTYVALGGIQLQVSMVSKEALRRALEDPGAYRDLVVRVAGFTAYFVSLPADLQHEILERS
jgi:trans-4-hydroxy-L-proline dehydratase